MVTEKGRMTTYSSNTGKPVSKNHVKKAPSVIRWAAGEKFEIESY